MKARTLALLIIFGCVFAPCIGCWALPTNRVTIVNESSQTAHELTVSISDRSYRFDQVPPGGAVSCGHYTPESSDDILIHCRYGGTVFDKGCWYVVREVSFDRRVIAIRDGGAYDVR